MAVTRVWQVWVERAAGVCWSQSDSSPRCSLGLLSLDGFTLDTSCQDLNICCFVCLFVFMLF